MSGDGPDETATEQVTFYLTPSERERLKREAREESSSISAYCASVFRRKWGRDETDRVAERLGAEERIERITKQATDEIEESIEQFEQEARAVRDIQAITGSYSIVNFYALKREFDLPEPWISDEFSRASRRLRGDADPFPDSTDDESNGDGESDRKSIRERLGIDDDD